MAKVTIDIDTEDKKVSVKIDEKSVSNVKEISISSADSFFGFSVDLIQQEKVDDSMTKTIRLSASDDKDNESEYSGFAINDDDTTDIRDLSHFLLPQK
jgi:hypothetical protein